MWDASPTSISPPTVGRRHDGCEQSQPARLAILILVLGKKFSRFLFAIGLPLVSSARGNWVAVRALWMHFSEYYPVKELGAVSYRVARSGGRAVIGCRRLYRQAHIPRRVSGRYWVGCRPSPLMKTVVQAE